MGETTEKDRIEKDFLGEKRIPADVYWGIHTARAMENFRISGTRVSPRLIQALALVKKAACRTNRDLGFIDNVRADAIERACDEVAAGTWPGQFLLDAYQGGAGTSTNMNVNEVVANRALELMGRSRGDYAFLHPLDHVNLHQSTNDVYPTALKIACIRAVRTLAEKAARLQGAFQEKEKAFAGIVKIGRTEMQEAVPMTLGAEFGAFAEAVGRDRWRTFKCEERLRVTNIGGTAVGTGLAAPREYIFLVIEKVRSVTGLNLSRGENAVDQTANADCFVEVSGILKAHASNLVKIANDLRLLNLLGEIVLPRVQSGSSLMPGKTNPVIAEAAVQAGLRVMANDTVIAGAVSAASLQISEFLPLVGQALLESLEMLIAVDEMLAGHVPGIEADPGRCRAYADRAETVVTAFLPEIGYERAERLLKEFHAGGSTDIRSFLEETLGKETVDRILSPEKLTSLGYRKRD